MTHKKIFYFLFLLILSTTQTAWPCTTFLMSTPKQKLMAKSYDWDYDHGLVIVNKRNVAKMAMPIDKTQRPAKWTSKYGSVTFNQVGRELPMGGVNEEGLSVEIMWLDDTKYPPIDKRPSLNELQWIQYQLDNYKSVKEMLKKKNVKKIRISGVGGPAHFMACDSAGSCATFELLNGKLVTHTDSKLPVNVLTNDTYSNSIAFLKKHLGFGGMLSIPQGKESLHRFTRASLLVKQRQKQTSIASGFNILSNIAQGDHTKWNIVYDLVNKELYFRTLKKKAIKKLDFGKLDYSCRTPVKILDLNNNLKGNVKSHFVNYTRAANKKIFTQSSGFIPKFPPEQANSLVMYPESTVCVEKG